MKKSLWIEFLSNLGGLFLILICVLIGFGISNKNSERECIMENNTLFDTTIIEAQEAITYDNDKGRIRIVHAWGFNKDENLVEDETGNLWGVNVEFEYNEALLLMIADNNTPNDFADDYVLRVWREA